MQHSSTGSSITLLGSKVCEEVKEVHEIYKTGHKRSLRPVLNGVNSLLNHEVNDKRLLKFSSIVANDNQL
jgi:hypothetical protein